MHTIHFNQIKSARIMNKYIVVNHEWNLIKSEWYKLSQLHFELNLWGKYLIGRNDYQSGASVLYLLHFFSAL